MASILIFYAWLVVNITKMRLFRFIHLFKIDNETYKPTVFQQHGDCQLGFVVPILYPSALAPGSTPAMDQKK